MSAPSTRLGIPPRGQTGPRTLPMELRWSDALTRYRDLILSLSLRELKIRYKTASLGLLWSLIHPLCLAAVFTFIFTRLLHVEIERFPLFLLCALFPWNFLHMTVASGTTAIVQSGNLIKKVAFPREAIPIAMVGVQLYHLIVALALLVPVLMVFGVRFGWGAGWLPALVLLQALFVLGITLACAAWHTYFRDVKYIVELGLLVWFYLTPVFYPVEALAPSWQQWLMIVNPMAVFVTLYRQVLLWGGAVDGGLFLYVTVISVAVAAVGWLWFRRAAPWFADVV